MFPNLAFSRISSRLSRAIYEQVEYRVYRKLLLSLENLPDDAEVRRDSFEDLLKFEQIESWHDRDALLADWRRRLESGGHVYTVANESRLLHFGWLRPQITQSHFWEVERKFIYPPRSAGLWDFYTHPCARGRGLYQSSIRSMLYDLRNEGAHEFAYIGVLADNAPSRHVIEKMNFIHEGSFHRRSIVGWRQSWEAFPDKVPGPR